MADRVLTRDTVTGQVSATLDPATLGGVGTRYHLPAPVAIVVPTDFQYIVQGALVIDGGASFTLQPGAVLVML